MLLGARTLALNSHSAPAPRLPYDYEVEYLQSDGVAYIDTGVAMGDGIKKVPEADFEVNIRWRMRDNTISNAAPVWGFSFTSTLRTNIAAYGVKNNTSDRFYATLLKVGIIRTEKTISAREFASVCVKLENGLESFLVNGNQVGGSLDVSASSYIWKADATNVFFGYRTNCVTSSSADASVTVSSSYPQVSNFALKTIRGEVDMIAVSKDGVGYMYDKISGQLFGNAASSGAFIVGDRIS